jgi:type IV secretory pathway component VirB8
MKNTLILLLLLAPTTVFAVGCDDLTSSEVIQKKLLADAVHNTEKQTVTAVDITAPGLAVVRYGKSKKEVRITFTNDCCQGASNEEIRRNPTGFRVTSYSLVGK